MKLALFVCLSLFAATRADASSLQQWNFSHATNCSLGEWGEEGSLVLKDRKAAVNGKEFELSYSHTPTGALLAFGGGLRSFGSSHRLHLDGDSLEAKARKDGKEFLVMSGRFVDVSGMRNETNPRSVTCFQAVEP